MYPKILVSFIEKEYIWFVPYNLGAIFRYNLENHKVEFITVFEKYSKHKNGYRSLYKVNDLIILAPYLNKDFLFYNIKSRVFEVYESKNQSILRFSSAVKKDDTIYFIGQDDIVAKCKYETKQVKFINLLSKEKKVNGNLADNLRSRGSCAVIGTHFLVPNILNASIVDFSMDTNAQKLSCVPRIDVGISDIVENKGWLVVLPRSGSAFYRWHRDTNKVEYIDLECDMDSYFHLFILENLVVIINFFNGDMWEIGENQEVHKNSWLNDNANNSIIESAVVRWAETVGNKLLLTTLNRNGIIQYDPQEKSYDVFPMNLVNKKYFFKHMNFEKIIREEWPYMSLSEYIHEIDATERINTSVKVGELIYHKLKELKI